MFAITALFNMHLSIRLPNCTLSPLHGKKHNNHGELYNRQGMPSYIPPYLTRQNDCSYISSELDILNIPRPISLLSW